MTFVKFNKKVSLAAFINHSMENQSSSTAAADNDNADYEETTAETDKEKQGSSAKTEDNKVSMYDDENDNDDGDGQGESAAVAGGAGSVESNSVFVSGLDESVTPSDLQSHFKSCGEIERITILVDKHTGKSKGHAYVEFKEPSAVEGALQFDGSTLGQKVCFIILF